MRSMAWMTRLAVFGALAISSTSVRSQEANPQATLARALRGKHVSLATGLEAATASGKPISAKYEYEEGKLQLSVYTEKGGQFSEVIINHHTGRIAKTEKIAAGDDLKSAQAQNTASAKATSSLAAAGKRALSAHAGYSAVSATATLKGGGPLAEIILVRKTTFKTVTQPLT